MVGELRKQNHNDINFFYYYNKSRFKKNSNRFVGQKETVLPIPQRLMIHLWKRFSWPKIESIISNCDLLYTNSFYFPPPKKALVLATIHGLAYRMIPEKIRVQTAESLNRDLMFLLKHADYLVAVSETTKKEIISKLGFPSNRIYVVTHGVDEQFVRRKNLQEVKKRMMQNYGIRRPYILYVGAIGTHKNIMGTLNAYDKIALKTTYDLVLAGPSDSAQDNALRFVQKRGLSENVHFLGHVANTDNLVDLYNGADLFVFPSFYEGWTLPPLEAMACGTPVIASNCSSLPETVGNAAIMVDPNKPQDLAFEIERVLSNQWLRQELIKAGLKHVNSHTWKKAAINMIEVFKDVLVRGSREKYSDERCN
jgi:glycosyltransferase involved in cell wall biosynthesis